MVNLLEEKAGLNPAFCLHFLSAIKGEALGNTCPANMETNLAERIPIPYNQDMGKPKNNLKQGRVRFIVFWDSDNKLWYGHALEFGVMVHADTKEEALLSLQDASIGYLQSLAHANIRINEKIRLLNQKAEGEYSQMWDDLIKRKTRRTSESYATAIAGILPVALPA